MSLKWTSEPPTEPGWYWVEWESGDRAIVEIEHMVDQDDEDYQGMGFHDGCYWTCLEDVGIVRFAGPIPQPEEEDATTRRVVGMTDKEFMDICDRHATATLEEVRKAYGRLMINAPVWAFSNDEQQQRDELKRAVEGPSK